MLKTLNRKEIQSARWWLEDCADCGIFKDLDPEDVDDLSDKEIIQAVARFYDGGIEGFKLDG